MDSRRRVREIVLLAVLSAGAAPAADRLPPESAMPSQAAIPAALPPESVLPEGFIAAAAPPPPAARFPGEDQLPPAFGAPEVPADDPLQQADDDVAKLDDSPDRIPWLRLDLAGHTSAIRSLVFTPDSQRLCSAGDDKSAIVWRRVDAPRTGQAAWAYERAIRWQIQRGPRGRIYALAAGDGLLALAGDGAMDRAKAVLVDPATGQWKAALIDDRVGTHPIVVSLSVSPDPQKPGVVSVQMDGQAMYWSPDPDTGLWKARQIQPTDREAYGPEDAARLLSGRRFSPAVMTSGRTVVLPSFAGRDARGNALWRLRSVDVISGAGLMLGGDRADATHTRMVMALAVSADGRRLASADDAGRVFLWDLPRGERPARFQMTAPVLSLAFDRGGERLLLGGYRRDASGAVLQLRNVHDLQRPTALWSTKVDDHVIACAISPDGRDVAYVQGTSVQIRPMSATDRVDQLRAPVRTPMRVAFARERPLYRIAFGYQGDNLAETFDAATVQLGRQASVDPTDWIPDRWWQGDWSVVTVPADEAGSADEETYWLARSGRRIARLPLRPGVEGAPTATCWIPDRQGKPLAVAIGTNGQNNIYVFRLSDTGDCDLLRMFRGHAAGVTSVGVSRDLRYLVSAAHDMTIRIWPVGDVVTADALVNRWGAEFAAEDGQLKITGLREDGPLFFRGVRVGDTIRRMMWRDQGDRITTGQPAEMLAALRQRPWQERLVFEHVRGGGLTNSFQIFPAWQPLVSLVVAENREWAFWAPSGFYDASFEGHRLFGWQVNRGTEGGHWQKAA
ncbi:MAG: hypothetical protein JJ992_15085, partial [Planctomycetes bacterium]|nr:hypothetical protein [Planctomycetota bacterium]